MTLSDTLFLVGIAVAAAAVGGFVAFDLRRCIRAVRWLDDEQRRMSQLEDQLYAEPEESASWRVKEHTGVSANAVSKA